MTHRPSTRSLAILLLSISIFLLHGCVTFREDNRPPIASWPLANSGTKQSIEIVLTGKRWFNEREIDANSVQRLWVPDWRKQAIKIFEESGLFREVKGDSEEKADVRAEINIEERTEYNKPLHFLSDITLWVIPIKLTDTLLVKAVIKDREGHVIADSEQTETMTTWRQFFLLFGYPFLDRPYPTAKAALEDLHRLVLQDVQQKRYARTGTRSSVW